MNNVTFTEQFNKLREQTNPNIHELERFLKMTQIIEINSKIRALKLKYLAMTTVPTTIEKTMSPYQLYETNSPLWAVELTARGIERFVNRKNITVNYQKFCSTIITIMPNKDSISMTTSILTHSIQLQ